MPRHTFERRDGRVTASEWRVVVVVGQRSARGPWCFTKRDAEAHVERLRRDLFDADEAEARLSAESQRRMAYVRVRQETDRRIA